MRKFVMVVAIVLVFLVLIVLSLPFLIDLNRYRDQYLPFVEEVLDRKVIVEDIRLTLFPSLGLALRDVSIADDPAFSSETFLKVPSVQVAVRWKPLLQRRIEVEHVVVNDPIVRVLRSEKGEFNFATIGKVSPPGSASQKSVKPPESVSSLLGIFAVKQFSLTGGTVHIEDRKSEPVKVHQIDELTVNTDSVVIGQTALMKVHGKMMPHQIPFKMTGKFGPLQANFDVPTLSIDGLFGKVAVKAQGAFMNRKLDLDVQIPKVSTEDSPIDLAVNKPIEISELQAHLSASFFAKDQNASSQEMLIDPLSTSLHLGKSTIHLFGKGTVSRFSLRGEAESLSSEDLPVNLSLQLPFTLQELEFTAEIRQEALALQSFKANTFEGTLLAQGVLEPLTFPMNFSTQGTFNDFAVKQLVQVMKPASLGMTGLGNARWNIHGVVPRSSKPEIHGPVYFLVQHGQIIGFDLVKAIEDALNMSGVLGKSTGMTQFSRMNMKAEFIPDGVAVQEFLAKAANFSLQGTGKIGLNRSVNLSGKLSVSREVAEKIIQRFPMAKMVRQDGALRLPFFVQGTVEAPKLRLDIQSVGNQVKKNVEKRIEKVLQGDDQELKKLLNEGKDLLKNLFGK